MRILHVSALPLWSMKGGAGMSCLLETLKGHVQGGHEVVFLMPRYHLFANGVVPLSTSDEAGFEVYTAPCTWFPALKSMRDWMRRLSGGKELLFPLRVFFDSLIALLLTFSLLLSAERLRRRSRQRFELVYAHCEYAALAGWLIGYAWGIPNVTRLYGTFLADLMKKPLIWCRYPVAVAGFAVPHSLLICANDGTRGDEVARRLGVNMERFRFWQDGVDAPETPVQRDRESFLKDAPDNLRKDSVWILSASRLSYWKRIDRIIDALAVCRREGCNAQLLIAGDGEDRKALVDRVGRLGLERDVVWLGAVPHKDIWRLMWHCDAFVITNDVTNRCNPLFEAIRAGLPVVSVIDPSTCDLLTHGENALLANREDTEALGRSLVAVCRSPDLAANLRQAQQRRKALLWTWDERMRVEVADLVPC